MAMAVVVVRVGCFLDMAVGQQHDEVGDQIGRRMNTVRDQALRLRENADDDLGGGEHHVHAHAHPGAAGGGGRAFGRAVSIVLWVFQRRRKGGHGAGSRSCNLALRRSGWSISTES